MFCNLKCHYCVVVHISLTGISLHSCRGFCTGHGCRTPEGGCPQRADSQCRLRDSRRNNVHGAIEFTLTRQPVKPFHVQHIQISKSNDISLLPFSSSHLPRQSPPSEPFQMAATAPAQFISRNNVQFWLLLVRLLLSSHRHRACACIMATLPSEHGMLTISSRLPGACAFSV